MDQRVQQDKEDFNDLGVTDGGNEVEDLSRRMSGVRALEGTSWEMRRGLRAETYPETESNFHDVLRKFQE